LEVLVAFAVLAVMIVPILQVFGGGLGATEAARAHSTAALLARSKLAEVGVAGTLFEGETAGSFEMPGYRWRQSIALDTSEVIPPDLRGIDDLIQAGAADRLRNRQRRRESTGSGGRRGGLGQDRTSEQRRAFSSSSRRRGAASSTTGGLVGLDANLGGSTADELIPYRITVTVEWPTFRGGGALTLSTLRLGQQQNNLRTGR
jgi:type II secretory pathway pseudopilin PulG